MKVKRKRPRSNSRARLKKINHSLYLEPWQSEQLAALSAKIGVPQQVLLRAGLVLVFEKYDTDLPEVLDIYVKQAQSRTPVDVWDQPQLATKASKRK